MTPRPRPRNRKRGGRSTLLFGLFLFRPGGRSGLLGLGRLLLAEDQVVALGEVLGLPQADAHDAHERISLAHAAQTADLASIRNVPAGKQGAGRSEERRVG